MYFGAKGASPQSIQDAFKDVAETLGAKQTCTNQIDNWWYFCSDIDWVFKSSLSIEKIEDVFLNFRAFPEEGSPTAFRYEILCAPFSSDLYTWSSNAIVALKGTPPDEETINIHLDKLGVWGRIVGFKFDDTHNKRMQSDQQNATRFADR